MGNRSDINIARGELTNETIAGQSSPLTPASARQKRGTTAEPQRRNTAGNNNDEASNEKLATFEMASVDLEDYPNEKIVFIKFLDDNDPRLLLLVTYNGELDTTYMKVLKIEKANKVEQQKLSEGVSA